MAKGSLVDHVALSLRVPRGQEGYWSIISDLGAEGRAFSSAEIDGRSNVDRRTIADYLKRLVKSGHVEIVETERTGAAARHSYRLVRSSREAPRLRRDGSEYPETARDRMWRSIKMLATFTAEDLAASTASEMQTAVPVETVKAYVKRLIAVEVLQVVIPSRGPKPATYRLLRNIGAAAPRILRTHAVFDPNSNTVLGTSETKEVA